MKSFITALTLVAVSLAFTSAGIAAEKGPADKSPAKKKAAQKQFTGVVEACDAGCIKVKSAKESKMFAVNDKTKVATADKKEAAIADVKCGDKVTVLFAEDGDKLIAKRIGPPAPAKKKQ